MIIIFTVFVTWHIEVRITFLFHSVWLKMNRTFFRYSPTIFLTLKNFYNCDCLKDFGQFITYKIQAYMFEIRIIGREKDGDCMYCHFGQDSENSVTLNPRGRGEIDPRLA